MSTTAPHVPPYQQAPAQQPMQQPYAQPPQNAWQAAPPQSGAPRPAQGSILRRWPVWAQNTAIIVGAVALLVVVFFAGFFTAHAVDGARNPFGSGQVGPRQFGGYGGFGGQGGTGDGSGSGSGGFGTQSGPSGNGS
jgi:uncharacterized membrane protein YgcG